MTVGVGSRCATASTDETTRGMTGTAISRYQARPSHNKFSVTKKSETTMFSGFGLNR